MTRDNIKSLFDYKDGKLYWKSNRCNNKIKAGQRAGTLHSKGYWHIKINGKYFLEHRLIWSMFKGECIPSVDLIQNLDHIDRDKLNNRIENLRVANKSENGYNTLKKSNNTSGYKGVCWHKVKRKWMAQGRVEGKKVYLGYYENIEDASKAYENFCKKEHKVFYKDATLYIQKLKDEFTIEVE